MFYFVASLPSWGPPCIPQPNFRLGPLTGFFPGSLTGWETGPAHDGAGDSHGQAGSLPGTKAERQPRVQKGGSQRGKGEVQKGRRSRPGPQGGGWGSRVLVPPAREPWRGTDDSLLASLQAPRPGPVGGLAGLTIPRSADTAPLFGGPARGRSGQGPGLAGKGPGPCPSLSSSLDRQEAAGAGRWGSPSCTLPLPKPGVLRDPTRRPRAPSAVPATAGRQVSGSRLSPRWCSSRTACPDRRPLSPPCRQVTPGHPDGPVRPGSGALRGPRGWRGGPLLPGDSRPGPASRGGQLQARPPATTASGNMASALCPAPPPDPHRGPSSPGKPPQTPTGQGPVQPCGLPAGPPRTRQTLSSNPQPN